MAEKLPYTITEKAGRFVAGQRKPASGTLMLSARQAAYELTLGTIVPFVAAPEVVAEEAPPEVVDEGLEERPVEEPAPAKGRR